MSKYRVYLLATALAVGCNSSESDDDSGASAGTGGSVGGSSGSSGKGSAGSANDAGTGDNGESGSGATSGGSAGMGGGSAGKGGGSAGKGGGSGTSGDLKVGDVESCQTPDPLGCEDVAGKPYHYECRNNPDNIPPSEGCESSASNMNWCCPEPFCTRHSELDESICQVLDMTKPHGYACDEDTPGLDKCAPFSGGTYCCP